MRHDMVREDTGGMYGGITDEQLAGLARDKQPHAFPELLNRFYHIMLYKVANVRPRGADADDMMQEASLGLLNAVDTYSKSEGASFRTYAGVCIDNRLKSAIRRFAREKNKPLTNYTELSAYYEQAATHEKADAGADPEAKVLISESVSELNKRVKNLLSDKEYTVFSKYLSGCSYGNIARSLGIEVKAVDNALQRVRRKLKDALLRD